MNNTIEQRIRGTWEAEIAYKKEAMLRIDQFIRDLRDHRTPQCQQSTLDATTDDLSRAAVDGAVCAATQAIGRMMEKKKEKEMFSILSTRLDIDEGRGKRRRLTWLLQELQHAKVAIAEEKTRMSAILNLEDRIKELQAEIEEQPSNSWDGV